MKSFEFWLTVANAVSAFAAAFSVWFVWRNYSLSRKPNVYGYIFSKYRNNPDSSEVREYSIVIENCGGNTAIDVAWRMSSGNNIPELLRESDLYESDFRIASIPPSKSLEYRINFDRLAKEETVFVEFDIRYKDPFGNNYRRKCDAFFKDETIDQYSNNKDASLVADSIDLATRRITEALRRR